MMNDFNVCKCRITSPQLLTKELSDYRLQWGGEGLIWDHWGDHKQPRSGA